MNYTKYYIADGLIAGFGSYANPIDAPVATDTVGVLFGIQGDPRTQKVQNGVLVAYTPPAPPPQVPWSVSPWQMRRAINQLNLRSTVESAVLAGSQDVKDGWDYATEFRRDNSLIAQVAGGLGLSGADLDNLFTLAASFQ